MVDSPLSSVKLVPFHLNPIFISQLLIAVVVTVAVAVRWPLASLLIHCVQYLMSKVNSAHKDSVIALHYPILFTGLSSVFLWFGLPIYGKSLGASALTIGGLYSVFTASTVLLRPAVGWGLDRFGRKHFFVAALGANAIAMVVFSLAGDIPRLYLARLVQGVGGSIMWVSVNTIVADLSASGARGQAMGRVDEMQARSGMYGAFVGFTLMFLLSAKTAWQAAFTTYAILAAISVFLAWKNVPETRPPSASAVESRHRIPRQLFILLVIVFTTGASAAMLSPIYLIFLQDKFTTEVSVLAWAFFPAGLVFSFLPSRLGRLSDRFGRAVPMAIGLIGAGLLSLFLPGLPSIVWLVVLYTLSAVGWAMADPAEAAMVADLTGSEKRGTGYGLYEFADSFGATVGPLLGGWLYDEVGRPVPFYLNGVVLLARAIWVLLLLRQQHPPDTPQEGNIAAETPGED